MAISQKYGRTWHFPFSPGTTSDDRIQHDYWNVIQAIPRIVFTEKLDGENNCLSKYGVFARSHAAPTVSPWTATIRQYWQSIKNDLGTLEIFLENLYAIHSLRYRKLTHHFHVFAIRDNGRWLSWEETKFYAATLDLPTVPEISIIATPQNRSAFEAGVLDIVAGAGAYDPVNALDGTIATMEGLVARNADSYSTDDFAENVFKYVRKGHVKTDQHWTRNWQRAGLIQEGGVYVDHQ
ncbi:RNA ligase family protein [Pseudoflavitalea sp. G-6-1-2]|uniref:RNA ligase family protein n=1 Tax=Pseudoflavitalea sp. G-6-1-2 TaxID=2728841 RepID=UPI00146C707E|nr:RNA ligase family protein [Pseudoflavitalea sp. G-6-1-2]NML22265.1 RNA ligase family protein [Pseudoflavitalea sp. G-6-1-2]